MDDDEIVARAHDLLGEAHTLIVAYHTLLERQHIGHEMAARCETWRERFAELTGE